MSSTFGDRAGIEQMYGTANVSGERGYADLDDDADATKITNRITAALAEANDVIGARFAAAGVTVPATGSTYAGRLTAIANEYAGAWMYFARGNRDSGGGGRGGQAVDGQMTAHLYHAIGKVADPKDMGGELGWVIRAMQTPTDSEPGALQSLPIRFDDECIGGCW